MKKFVSLLSVFMLLFSLSGAALAEKKISVVATIFPIYDWVRQIAGENLSNIDLTLLLDNGVDLHSYQPTAQDILKISSADLLIYVGGESDEWVEDVLESAVNPQIRTISLVEALGEDVKLEEEVEGMEAEEEEEEEEVDEHVWLSLRNAEKLTGAIAEEMAQIDPANADVYQRNARAYAQRLADLDERYQAAVSAAACDTLLFADRFPFRYLVDDYGLSYYAAFSGCSAESEASFATIVFLAQKVNELNLPAVLTIEGNNHRVAETVVATSGSKDALILTMNSLQSATAQQAREGVTYLSVMEANLEVLREALTK